MKHTSSHRNTAGQFTTKPQKYAVGEVTVRTRHSRGGVQRAWVKIAEPNSWKLRAVLVWESVHGPAPRNRCIHHIDGNSLNDDPANLALVSMSEHLALHRSEHVIDRRSKSATARAARFWSTKGIGGKRTGRHPKGCTCEAHKTKPTAL